MKFFFGRSPPKFTRPVRPALGPGGIDARKRAGELSDADLIRGADGYFAKFTTDSIQYKKPFSDPDQAIHQTRHLGLLLQAADLFRGAKVMDFGCATGWLSLGMAQMGCDVVGVDISAAALKLAERLKATRRVPSDGQLDFNLYDGQRLPVADATFDRIVCCDSFHHVRDQAHVLREFARVLKDGGRIAFVEPGPNHSLTAKSQEEMRLYKVLENDVSISEVARHAQAAGLNAPEMLVQFQRPLQLSVQEYQQWAEQGVPKEKGHQLLLTLAEQLTDTQFFSIMKGQPRLDSRKASGLAGELRLLDHKVEPAAAGGRCVLRFAARNTGQSTWLTGKGVHGQVKVGAQVYGPDGSLVNLDFTRFDLEDGNVQPGQEVTLEARFKLPVLPAYILKFDLVAEHVVWFGQLGTVPVELPSGALVPGA